MEKVEEQPCKRSRGIYLLPNLFTTAALFGGFFAILSAINGNFQEAVIAIFIAMVLDGLDGRVARLTHTQSAFGAEYDSLSDMVAFGLAPALVVYLWALHGLGKFGWLAAFIYTAGAALRLARFNTQIETADKRYFQGLPSPSAAAVLAGGVWVSVYYQENPEYLALIAAILTILAGLLMVSNVRYNSFKELDLRGRIPFVTLVAIMLGFAVFVLHPPMVLFVGFLAYLVSGPVLTLARLKERRAARRTQPQEGD
ncbi:MAG: CDP-diacylglycerol--serine O-phosphatidyltransferase [Gammaproteobacteria bacterium]|nr:CDP-diacylglycerol--serine O-phosphatidyltransferase [Gammaproteobacteria bacterium]MBU1654674.1 CDP-diacylglycerol--serine O-phosphatidyltransferase [Gammaproteobacteria bacterium]MBU1961398.1 CDP-diacylglycerol--serine O-phosphatidyltransferase [Gammaproteobacteria bacterium]